MYFFLISQIKTEIFIVELKPTEHFWEIKDAKKNENPLFPFVSKWLTYLKELNNFVLSLASFEKIIFLEIIFPKLIISFSLSLIIVCSIIICIFLFSLSTKQEI